MSKTLLIILGLAAAIGIAFWLFLSGPNPEPAVATETTKPTPVAITPTEESAAAAKPTAAETAPVAEATPTPAEQPASEPEIVAEVGGIPIERSALEKATDSILAQYSSLYSQMGQDFSAMLTGASGYSLTLGVEAQALDRLVFAAIADAEIQKRSLVVTDEELDAEFTKQYEQFLTSQGLTEETLAALLANQNVTLDAFKESGRSNIREQLRMLKLQASVAGPVEVDDATLQAYWEANRDSYDTPEQVCASHILVKTEDEAKVVLADLEAGADFATVAKEKSTDTSSAVKGGDLGCFAKGTMVQAFEDAAFSLDVGQRTGIVQTQYGYHIILVTGKKPAVQPELADVRDKVLADAKQERVTELANAWYTQVMAEAEVAVHDPILNAARLQRMNSDLGLAAFEAVLAAGTDKPYISYVIGTLYENRIQTLTRTKTQLEGAETRDEARIADLEAQIQEARTRAIAAYQATLTLVGTDPTVQERLGMLQSSSQTVDTMAPAEQI